MILEFGEWLPDLPALGNPGVLVASGAIPTPMGYRPVKDISTITDALTGTPLGVGSGTDAAGNVFVFAGDATKLYRLSAASWSDVSLTTYSATTAEPWEFVAYEDRMVAVNINDNPQSWVMGTSSAFANLTTTVKARHAAVVRDFLVLGSTNDGTYGSKPFRMWWSALGDPTDFTPAAATQCDFQDNPGGGWCQKVIGGEYGIGVYEKALWRMTYVGSPAVWQFDEVIRNRGALTPGAVANVGTMVFFLDADGFYMFDGQDLHPIGAEKVDRYFFNDLDQGYIDRVSATIDPNANLYIVSYPASGNNGEPNMLLIYNYQVQRWSIAAMDLDLIGQYRAPGYDVDTLGIADIDAVTINVDDRAYQGGDVQLIGFQSKKLGTFSGSNIAATLDTKEAQPAPRRRSFVPRAWPLVDGGTLTTQIGSRVRQVDSVTWGSAIAQRTDGSCPTSSEGRFHRARVNIAAGGTWSHAQGVEIEAVPTGMY